MNDFIILDEVSAATQVRQTKYLYYSVVWKVVCFSSKSWLSLNTFQYVGIVFHQLWRCELPMWSDKFRIDFHRALSSTSSWESAFLPPKNSVDFWCCWAYLCMWHVPYEKIRVLKSHSHLVVPSFRSAIKQSLEHIFFYLIIISLPSNHLVKSAHSQQNLSIKIILKFSKENLNFWIIHEYKYSNVKCLKENSIFSNYVHKFFKFLEQKIWT